MKVLALLIKEISFSGIKLSQDIALKQASKLTPAPNQFSSQSTCLKLNSRQMHYWYYCVLFF